MKKVLLAVLVLIGLQTQAQINYCDSISYTTSSTMSYPFIVTGDASPFINAVDSIVWSWSVCNSSLCYTGSGTIASFGQVITTDTLKVCYDAYIYLMGATYICTSCDSLVYDQNSYSWVLFNMGNPLSINELQLNTINDGKIYDMLGRELNETPVGTMYIRNKKIYITR
jgi:hypothetical protein